MLRWCFDLDGTLCDEKPKGTSYEEYTNVEPIEEMVEFLQSRKDMGDYIIINTARHMVSTNSNQGLINARVGKITLDWLDKHNIPYDEIYFAKPYADYYVDDKAVPVQDIDIVDHWE